MKKPQWPLASLDFSKAVATPTLSYLSLFDDPCIKLQLWSRPSA